MTVAIDPLPLPVDATVELPGSKSHANRALVLAALGTGSVELRRATPSDDVRLLAANLRRMGYAIDTSAADGGRLRVTGGIPAAPATSGPVELDCALAGTTLRFLCAVAALTPGDWIVTGNARMRRRPIRALTRALADLGVPADDRDGCPPVRIRGGTCRGGQVRLDASVSSQFVSALALIAPRLPGGLHIEFAGGAAASAPYLELTADTLRQFGCSMQLTAAGCRIAPGTPRRDAPLDVEADWSSAGPWLVLERLLGHRIRLPGLAADSTQGDRRLPALLDRLDRPGACTLDVSGVPDQTMNLAVRAAFRGEPTTFTGAANLRVKESDRLAVTASALRAFGIEVRETDDGLVVGGGGRLRRAAPEVAGDHRMAMAWAVLGAAGPGADIAQPDCVAKSYPDFFTHLAALRETPACLAVVGMRGAGKSALARALGPALGLEVADTDALFTARHGPIADWVARHGWPRFRALEATLVDEALVPGRVVALGGGALEDATTAARVRERALGIRVDEEVDTLVDRIRNSDRPPLSGAALDDEVRTLLAQRQAGWRAVTDLRLPPGQSVADRVAAVRTWLDTRPLPRSGAAAGSARAPYA